jgi:hypothetical protein
MAVRHFRVVREFRGSKSVFNHGKHGIAGVDYIFIPFWNSY